MASSSQIGHDGSWIGIPRVVLIQSAVAGVVLGVAYALSPVTIWFGVAMAGLFAWAGRRLPERERLWIMGLLTIAVALRVLAVSVLFLSSDHHAQIVSFFWDGDGAALKRRALSIRDVWLGNPLSSFYFNVAFDRLYGWTTYLYVLAYLQYLLGPAPYAIHLLNVTLCMAAAVAMYRLVRSAYGAQSALLGFALLLFLPTPFAWSVSALKESLYVFLAVVALVAAVTALRARSLLARAFPVTVLAAAMAVIGGVRAGGMLIAGLGLATGALASLVVRRIWLVIASVALVVGGAAYLSSDAGFQARIMSQLNSAAVLHIGHVRTEGHSYKLLDQHFYSEPSGTAMTSIEAARFTARAFASFVVVPLPSQIESASEIAFLPGQILWYLLVMLALVGLVAGIRRDPLVTCLLASFAVVGAAVIALNSGNIGTMVRHRDTIVPFVVWLSALGATVVVSSLLPRTVR
jgi:hypothetical protein